MATPNTLNTLDKQKYLDALSFESPDAVLGNLMSDTHYQLHLKNIIDPCDWLHQCNYKNLKMTKLDKRIIQTKQPMFYNAKAHREVNKADVIRILKKV